MGGKYDIISHYALVPVPNTLSLKLEQILESMTRGWEIWTKGG
jgi:hypothetical protein